MRCTVKSDGSLDVALARRQRGPLRVRLLPPSMGEGEEDAVEFQVNGSVIAFVHFDEEDAKGLAEFLAYHYPNALDYGINVVRALEDEARDNLATVG